MSYPEQASSWRTFYLIAFTLAIGVMCTTLIGPLLPFYQEAWHLPTSTLTYIYVAYTFAVILAFLFLGRLTDHLGALTVLMIATGLVIVALFMSAFAPNAHVLIAARIVIGVASGLITTAATIGLTSFEPAGTKRIAPLVTSSVTMAGFGCGPIAAGMIAQWLPHPLQMPYLILAIPTCAALYLLLQRRHIRYATPATSLSFKPSLVMPKSSDLPVFLVLSMSVFTAYALFNVIASLGPSFLGDILPWHGPLVSGAAISLVLLCSTFIQFPMRRVKSETCLRYGLSILAFSTLGLGIAIYSHSATLFFITDVILGLGHGMTFMSAVALIVRVTHPGNRAGIVSSFFTIGYLGIILPILAVGILADHIGVSPATIIFAFVFAAIALGLSFCAKRYVSHIPLQTSATA